VSPAVSLVRCERALVDAALAGETALAHALGHAVAEGWLVFPASLEHVSTQLAADPGAARWGPRFIVVDTPRTHVGWGGFKGAPDAEGTVEIGYSVAPAWEGRGVATAAVAALLAEAWAAPGVRSVIAHTLAERNASGRVLEKSGFHRDGETLDGDVGLVWRYRRDRDAAPAPGDARTAPPASG
jgi:RimJ/RimL family protein N-acetyltransferase